MYNNVHSYAFLFILRLILAELTNLSVIAEIIFGLAITLVNLWLLFSIFAHFIGQNSSARYLLLPVLSVLVFSYSQISTYSYGEAILQRELTHLGIFVGAWMLLLRSKSSFAPWAMLVCGILASFSGGGGLLAWPVFLIAMIITNTGNLVKYITWLAGLIIGVLPYLLYSKINPLISGFDQIIINRIITGLGLPMANNINYAVQDHPGALNAGLIGLCIFILAIFFLFLSRSQRQFKIAIPSFIFISWGILCALEIALFRSFLAPWYTSEYILFWIGLVGLCIGMIWPASTLVKRKLLFFQLDTISRIAGISGLIVITILFLRSNLTYTDKTFYLNSRSPASAACLRNYHNAPTYCESFVFQWGVGNPSYLSQMASVLDKYHWSVLGPHQEWTLQGDYILGNVSSVQQTEPENIRWVFGALDEPSFWTDYHHLNLLINPGQSILWQIDLPSNLSSAQFNMGLSLKEKTSCQGQKISIQIETSSEPQELVYQKQGLCNFINEFQLVEDLLDYAGKRLIIKITNDNNTGEDKAIRLHYPRILIDENQLPEKDQYALVNIRPLNTDLSSKIFPLKQSSINSIISITDPEYQNLLLQGKNGLMVRSGQASSVGYTPAHPICLLNWSQFYFDLGLTDSIQKKKVGIKFQFRENNGISREVILDFPLLEGEEVHAYSLDLDLFDVPYSECITFIEFKLFDGLNNASNQWVQIDDVGFLPRTPLRFGFYP